MKLKLNFLILFTLITNGLHAETTPEGLSDAQWQSIENQITGISQQAYIKSSKPSGGAFGFSTAIFKDTLVVGARAQQSDAGALGAGAVYVFTRARIDGVWSQQARLEASTAGAGDRFGASVSISNRTIVVGAVDESSNATGVDGDESDNSLSKSGAAYVFTRTSGGVWTQQAYLKSSNPEINGQFGGAVAVSDDTIVIGASGENHIANQSGAAYVFTRNAGVWTQQADLFTTASAASASSGHFGNDVDISNDTIAIAAQNENARIGGVYLFTRTSTTWSLQEHIIGSNTESGDSFGSSISLEGDMLVAGASNEDSNATGVNGNQDDNSVSRSGAAYVFTRNTGLWTQQAYLKASNPDLSDNFGVSVAVHGNTVVVGARWEQSNATGIDGDDMNNSINASGAAYTFTLKDENWVPGFYIKASNTQQAGQGDWFGTSVAVYSKTIAVGAIWEDSNATGINGDENNESSQNSGAVYLYKQISDIIFDDDFEQL